MKHVQSKRAARFEVRPADEKGHVALVLTAEGVHSDVYVLTLLEAHILAKAVAATHEKVTREEE